MLKNAVLSPPLLITFLYFSIRKQKEEQEISLIELVEVGEKEETKNMLYYLITRHFFFFFCQCSAVNTYISRRSLTLITENTFLCNYFNKLLWEFFVLYWYLQFTLSSKVLTGLLLSHVMFIKNISLAFPSGLVNL